MKRAFGTRKGYRALRFMAATPPLHTSRRLVLHIRKANASFNIESLRFCLVVKEKIV